MRVLCVCPERRDKTRLSGRVAVTECGRWLTHHFGNDGNNNQRDAGDACIHGTYFPPSPTVCQMDVRRPRRCPPSLPRYYNVRLVTAAPTRTVEQPDRDKGRAAAMFGHSTTLPASAAQHAVRAQREAPGRFRIMSLTPKIIYTFTDEAPALATRSLPIVQASPSPPASPSKRATSRWPAASSPSSPTILKKARSWATPWPNWARWPSSRKPTSSSCRTSAPRCRS